MSVLEAFTIITSLLGGIANVLKLIAQVKKEGRDQLHPEEAIAVRAQLSHPALDPFSGDQGPGAANYSN